MQINKLLLFLFFSGTILNSVQASTANKGIHLGQAKMQPVAAKENMTATLEQPVANKTDTRGFAGEFFGVQVPMENYYFVKAAISIFGNKWGERPQTPAQLEEATWDQLLLSFVAFNQNIQVSQEEIDAELGKVLAAEKVSFDWKKDPPAFENWVKSKTGESALLFENQIKHLLQLEKLHNLVMENIKPEIQNQEAYQEFLNAHSSLNLELVQLENQGQAEEFYRKVSLS